MLNSNKLTEFWIMSNSYKHPDATSALQTTGENCICGIWTVHLKRFHLLCCKRKIGYSRSSNDKVEHQDDPRQIMCLEEWIYENNWQHCGEALHCKYLLDVRNEILSYVLWWVVVWATLNCVPNQKDTMVSLLSWAQTYSTDMIIGIISSWQENKQQHC